GGSHDEFHFERPQHITGDPAPTPIVAVRQTDIVKRLTAKRVLRDVFRELVHEKFPPPRQTHGEFGRESPHNPEELCRQIHKIYEGGRLERLLNGVFFVQSQDYYKQTADEIRDWVLKPDGLAKEVVEKTQNLREKFLSERLAEAGILPLFGMPTRIRYLYHGPINMKDSSIPSIDRDLELAIYDFAPGNSRTKDKALHVCVGICPPLIKNPRSRDVYHEESAEAYIYHEQSAEAYRYKFGFYRKCQSCDAYNLAEEDAAKCFNCGAAFDSNSGISLTVLVPEGFCTDLRKGLDTSGQKFKLPSGARKPIFALTEESDIKLKYDDSFRLEYFAAGETWRINDNKGRGFNL
ncbi:MAG: hypothetical protein NZ534_12845, partial [Bacteroidia bacterium]|nr:hypothetical protein [Bacteroidia bacterium]